MGISPYCDKTHNNKGAWTQEEDQCLIAHIRTHGEGRWRSVPKAAGLLRCGRSCRLRWNNYLRPDLRRGNFSEEENELIIKLQSRLGNKWSLIASILPGRTDNEIKNYWNTHIKRKLISRGLDPQSHRPLCPQHKSNTTRSSQPAPHPLIPVFQSPGTPEIADLYFNQDRSGSSLVQPAAPNGEEHPDLNLDLCISLPSSCSVTPSNSVTSGLDRIVDSNSNSVDGVCCDIGLRVNNGGFCESRYCEQIFSHFV